MISNNELASMRSKAMSIRTYNTRSPMIKNSPINKTKLIPANSSTQAEIK